MNRFHRVVCRSSYWRRTLEEKLLPWALEDTELGDDVLEVAMVLLMQPKGVL